MDQKIAILRQITIIGYDSQLTPRIPYEIGRLRDDEDRIVFVHHAANGMKKALVAPSPDASAPNSQVAFASGTANAADVFVFVDQRDYQPGWTVKTRHYSLPFLKGLTVWSTNEHVSWLFELTLSGGHRNEFIYVQGPFEDEKTPALEALVGDGMKAVDSGILSGICGEGRWIEIAYEFDGKRWKQRRYSVAFGNKRALILTAQALSENGGRVFAVATRLAENLTQTTSISSIP